MTKWFDGDILVERQQTHISNKQVHTITNAKFETAVSAQVRSKMTTKIETLDQRHVDNTRMGSGRQLYKLTNYLLRRFETQALRCLSYIPMPEHSFMLNAV